MKAVRRFKRKVRALKAQQVGLLRELSTMRARRNRRATPREPVQGVKK